MSQSFRHHFYIAYSVLRIQRIFTEYVIRVMHQYTETPLQTVRITHENSDLLRGGFDGVRQRLDEERPCIAIVQENQAVSICRTVRTTQKAHEAGVATLPAFRGQGFAAEVVEGWATAVTELGIIPLYSTSWENVASQRVAQKLDLALYGVTFHIT